MHAWRMHGTCRAYMPHMPLVVPRLLCEDMVCLGEELLDLLLVECLVLRVRVGVGWGFLASAVSSAWC